MANYANLKAAINTVIKANGQQEITGTLLNQTLTTIVNSLGTGYQYMGVATPSTNPGTPDQNVFYLATEEGVYVNFNNVQIYGASLKIFTWNGTWKTEDILDLVGLEQKIEDIVTWLQAYQPIVIEGNVNNAPDEEDLTSVDEGGTNVLKFKNKVYAPALFSGLGREYLRKKITETDGENKNILTQSMINKPNTIYIIQYDYDLNDPNGENPITIPENCILEFDGGSLRNGTIEGQNTGINAGLIKIFNTDVTIAGSWNVAEAFPEWFGAIGDGVTDDGEAIRSTLSSFNKVILSSSQYKISTPYADTEVGLQLLEGTSLVGKNHGRCNIIFDMNNITDRIKISNACTLENLYLKGTDDSVKQNSFGITQVGSSYVSGIIIRNCNIDYVDTGLYLRSYLSEFNRCRVRGCKIGFKIEGVTGHTTTSCTLINCYALSCSHYGYYLSYLIYSSLINCAADFIGANNNGRIANNYGIAYYMNLCRSTSLYNIGSERCQKFLYALSSTFTAHCHSTANYTDTAIGTEDPNPYYIKIQECYMGYICGFINIDGIPSETTPIIASVMLNRSQPKFPIRIYNLKAENIYFSNASVGEGCFWTDLGNTNGLLYGDLSNSNILLDKTKVTGRRYYDTISKRNGYYNGVKFTEEDGASVGVKRVGTISERPIGTDIYVGFNYFDTSLLRAIWAKEINNETVTWCDANGTIPLPTAEINQFTQDAINLSGSTLNDRVQHALDYFFMNIGAFGSEDENTIFSKIDYLYLPMIANSINTSFANYKTLEVDGIPNSICYELRSKGIARTQEPFSDSNTRFNVGTYTFNFNDFCYFVFNTVPFSESAANTGYTVIGTDWNLVSIEVSSKQQIKLFAKSTNTNRINTTQNTGDGSIGLKGISNSNNVNKKYILASNRYYAINVSDQAYGEQSGTLYPYSVAANGGISSNGVPTGAIIIGKGMTINEALLLKTSLQMLFDVINGK